MSLFHGIAIKDLCISMFAFVSVRDLARMGLACKQLRRDIFHNDALWRDILTRLYPFPAAWAPIALDSDEALLLLLDMKDEKDDKYLERFLQWKYISQRLAAPPASLAHLKFYMRIDTTGDMPSVVLAGELVPQAPQTKEDTRISKLDRALVARGLSPSIKYINTSHNMYARDKDGKLLIGKLREDRLKLTSSNDPFFRVDRHTNNNGLLDDYIEEGHDNNHVAEPEPPKREPKKVVRARREFPRELEFIFQKLDKKPFAYWREYDHSAYCGRISSQILYALDRAVKGPMIVVDVQRKLDAYVAHGTLVNDNTMLAALVVKSGGVFDAISKMTPYVELIQSKRAAIPVKALFELYGPK